MKLGHRAKMRGKKRTAWLKSAILNVKDNFQLSYHLLRRNKREKS